MKPDNQWKDRASKVQAQSAPGTNSKRWSAFVDGVYPSHVKKADKCYLWDAWDNKYIDFISGLGTNLLGYNHPKISERVKKEIDNGGGSHSLPSHLEIEVAEKIQELIPCAERIRFLKSGNEATLAAIRIARAKTGKDYIASTYYHGHSDLWTSLTPPGIGIRDNFKIYDPKRDPYTVWNTNTACWITEPLYLDVNDKNNFPQYEGLLIFDEIVCGFRVPKYCVSNWWDIRPDIICLGKAIANGYPLSIVAGKKEVMNSGEYFISSTFSGETISLAACSATIDELKKKSLEDLMFYGQRFCDRFNEICKPIGSKIEGYGTRGQTDFYENDKTVLLFQELCTAGVLFGRVFFWNFAHMEEQIEEQVLNLVADAVNRIWMGKVTLEGERPKESFKR